MTDLEITRACALAMEIPVVEDAHGPYLRLVEPPHTVLDAADRGIYYSPLEMDSQAMALVKRFGMTIQQWKKLRPDSVIQKWVAWIDGTSGEDADLNRAICLCVAQLPPRSKG